MKDIRSTVMQLSGRWGNTCYATLCLAVEAALDLPYGDVQMKHLWSAIHERTGKSPQAISRALARAAADVWERGNRELLEAIAGLQPITDGQIRARCPRRGRYTAARPGRSPGR